MFIVGESCLPAGGLAGYIQSKVSLFVYVEYYFCGDDILFDGEHNKKKDYVAGKKNSWIYFSKA